MMEVVHIGYSAVDHIAQEVEQAVEVAVKKIRIVCSVVGTVLATRSRADLTVANCIVQEFQTPQGPTNTAFGVG